MIRAETDHFVPRQSLQSTISVDDRLQTRGTPAFDHHRQAKLAGWLLKSGYCRLVIGGDKAVSAAPMPNHNAPSQTHPEPLAKTPTPIGWLTVRPQFLATGKGRRLHTPRMTMQYRAQEPDRDTAEPAMPRFGLTVTKKTGNSVERNRIKRRLRAALRLAPLDGSVANDYVLVARRDCLAAPFGQLITDIVESCAKAVAKSAPATHLPPRPDSRS